jgi:hypothetical protein
MLQIFKEVQAGDICRFAPVLESFLHTRPKFFLPWLKNVALDLYGRICSFAGYRIHRIQSEIIFHLNSNLYTEWLGKVDRQYLAFF